MLLESFATEVAPTILPNVTWEPFTYFLALAPTLFELYLSENNTGILEEPVCIEY